jgi:hypothetical protein
MINREICVDIPTNLGVFTYPKENPLIVRYIINAANKNWWDSVKKERVAPKHVDIGRVCNHDKSKMHPNDNYYKYFTASGFDDLPEYELFYSDRLHYGPFALFNHASSTCGVYQALTDTFGEDDAKLISSFALYMLCENDNTAQKFEDFQYDYYTNLNKIVNGVFWCRFFKNGFDEAKCKNFYKRWIEIWKEKFSQLIINDRTYVAIDSTNNTTASKESDNSLFGHPKKNDGFPQVNTAVFHSSNTSHPLAMEMYKGNQPDNTTVKQLLELAKEYGLKNCTFLFDRGYWSEKNIKLANKLKFMMMCSQVSADTKKHIHDNTDIYMKSEYKIVGMNAYCINYKTADFGDINLNIYVYIDEDTKHLQITAFHNKLDKAEDEIKNQKKYDVAWANSYSKWFEIKKVRKSAKNPKGFTYERKHEQITKETKNLGFFAVITNVDKLSSGEVLTEMRRRYIVEHGFRMGKTKFGMEKFRVMYDESMEAKEFIALYAEIVGFELLRELKVYLNKTANSSLSLDKIFKLMNRLEIEKKNEIWKPTHQLRGKQQEILAAVGINKEQLYKDITGIKL